MYFDVFECGIYFIMFEIVQGVVFTLKQKILFVHFDEYECGTYFNEVWNCPECSVNSETKTVFEEHLTQEHHFLFVFFDEYECCIYFN